MVEPESPVEATQRFASIDALRGVALLGILAMNIVGFAWPEPVYDTPTLAPGYTWADLAIWMFTYTIFDTKMMTIFSMLFGAGLVLMSDRAEARGGSVRRIYYRRVTFLLLIGLVHAYLIWDGDILVFYAMSGFALYPFRRLSGPTLVAIGVGLLLLALPTWLALREFVGMLDASATQAGTATTERSRELAEIRKKISDDEPTRRKKFQTEIEVYRGDYRRIVAHRATNLFNNHVFGFILVTWWQLGGRMLIGMGLMKLGVFSARRSRNEYTTMATVGYGIGLPLVFSDIAIDWYYNFFISNPIAYATGGWWLVREASGPFLTLGHVAVIMILYQAGALTRLFGRLAAVGRMALTNYLMQSFIGTTLFYGYGFGLYARVHRPGLALIVLTIWVVQLWLSPIWLAHFRFGPAEWLWRSLTYGTPQPIRPARPEMPPESITIPDETIDDC
jgi:uncharacterized protein